MYLKVQYSPYKSMQIFEQFQTAAGLFFYTFIQSDKNLRIKSIKDCAFLYHMQVFIIKHLTYGRQHKALRYDHMLLK